MTAAAKLTPRDDVNPFDEIDCIEADAEPTAADVARLEELTQHPDALVQMSAKQVLTSLRFRRPAEPTAAAGRSLPVGPTPTEHHRGNRARTHPGRLVSEAQTRP